MSARSIVSLGEVLWDLFPDGPRFGGAPANFACHAALRALLVRFELDLVAMTRGPRGALLVSATATIDQPGFQVVVRDTVGAGDAFTTALVMGLLKSGPLATIARGGSLHPNGSGAAAALEYLKPSPL